MIIILSQNKNSIVKCKNIRTEECDIAEFLQVIDVKIHSSTRLGTYATEERAKEVVSEIFGMILRNEKYYEMPQK